MHKLIIAAALAGTAMAAPASAATFLFTVTGGATGSGTIEATPFSATAATVNAISGVINGSVITGLRGYKDGVNDNVLRFGDDVKFTSAGIGFFQGAVRTDLYYNFALGNYRMFTSTGGVSSINFELVDAAVPEPATWAMMMLGFGGLGYAMRRKNQVSTRIRFA